MRPPRSLLAKVLIVLTAVVALATSPTPTWRLIDERELQVPLVDQREQQLLLTIEIDGPLYQDTADGRVEVMAIADRTAYDLTLQGRALTPDTVEVTLLGPGDLDAGAALGRPSEQFPDRASLLLQLTCTQIERSSRQQSCIAQVELTVARESEQPLCARLVVETDIEGREAPAHQPPGTFEVSLEPIEP